VTQGVNPHSSPSPPADPCAERGTTPADPPEQARDDAELLQAHVDGNPQAFATLVRRHQDRLWAIALRVMRNPDDAADALQDAYIAGFRRAGSFRGDAAVTTWLHRVVVNACLDRLRSLKVRAADALPEDLDRSPQLAVDEPTDPVEAAEQRDQVIAALDRLNVDQRAALVLVDMQGYSVEEAATILGCAPGTVKSRCARGRAKLAPLLEPLGAGDDPLEAPHAHTGPREPTRKGDDPLGPPPRTQQHTGAREAERST
jgi:RNA polymerase sigma-70 factor, ECF subfamily